MITLAAPTVDNVTVYEFESGGTSPEQLLPRGKNQVCWGGEMGVYALFGTPGQVEDPSNVNGQYLDVRYTWLLQASAGANAFKVTAPIDGFTAWYISNLDSEKHDSIAAPTEAPNTVPPSTNIVQSTDGHAQWVIMRCSGDGYFNLLFGSPDTEDIPQATAANSPAFHAGVTYCFRVVSGATAFKANVGSGGILYWYQA